MKYVYKVEPIKVGAIGFLNDSGKQEKQLGASGSDGWELVCVSEGKKYLKYVYCKAVSDEEYEAEAAKVKAEKVKKPKVPLTPEQIKKRNWIWTIAVAVVAVITAIMAICLSASILPEVARLEVEYDEKAYGIHYGGAVEMSPGHIIGLIALIAGVLLAIPSFFCKKQWLWIITAVIVLFAFVFIGFTMLSETSTMAFYQEELALLATGGNG